MGGHPAIEDRSLHRVPVVPGAPAKPLVHGVAPDEQIDVVQQPAPNPVGLDHGVVERLAADRAADQLEIWVRPVEHAGGVRQLVERRCVHVEELPQQPDVLRPAIPEQVRGHGVPSETLDAGHVAGRGRSLATRTTATPAASKTSPTG